MFMIFTDFLEYHIVCEMQAIVESLCCTLTKFDKDLCKRVVSPF